METRTLDAIMKALALYIPARRTIREILGALVDLDPTNSWIPRDWTNLKSDVEVVAFFRMTVANTYWILLILHRNDGMADTPEPDPNIPYFALTHFDPPETSDDIWEDSDTVVRDAAEVGACRLPTKDHTFEERQYRIRQPIKRQQILLLQMKHAHQTKFPNVGIIDTDDEHHWYIQFLKNPEPKTGALLIKARQVVLGARLVRDAAEATGTSCIASRLRAPTSAQVNWEALNQ